MREKSINCWYSWIQKTIPLWKGHQSLLGQIMITRVAYCFSMFFPSLGAGNSPAEQGGHPIPIFASKPRKVNCSLKLIPPNFANSASLKLLACACLSHEMGAMKWSCWRMHRKKKVNHPNWKHPRRSVDNVSQNVEMKQINAHDLEQSQLMWVKQCHVYHP